MSLLLTVYNTPVWKKLIDASGLPSINEATPVVHTKSAALQPPQPIPTISALLLGLSTGEALWVAVVQAEHYLAHAIETGTSLTEAAKAWEQQTGLLLNLQRQHRQQLKLFNLHQALAQPAAFRQCLAKFPIAEFNAEQPASSLPLLVACQYLSQHSDLRELNTRLQASVLPLLDDEKLVLNLDQILLQNHSNSSAAAERDLILTQLFQIQEQFEAANLERAELRNALEKSKAEALLLNETQIERDAIKGQLQGLQAQLKITNEKHDNALKQSKKTEAEFEKRYSELQTVLADRTDNLGKKDLQIAELKDDLKALSETRNKLDQAEKELGRKNQQLQKLNMELNATREERDIILTQLHQVQEQLEQHHIALQIEQQDNKHALLARDKQQAKEIAKLESEIRKTKARAANAEFSGQLLQKELEKLKASISWKAGVPVRVIGRLIRKKDPARDKIMQEVGLLLTSEYFDVDWYLRTYTDVAQSQMNPAEHYLLHGAAEGRLPGPLFDGNWYLQQYPDVAESRINPLLHFIMHGQQEGRSSSPIMLTNGHNPEE